MDNFVCLSSGKKFKTNFKEICESRGIRYYDLAQDAYFIRVDLNTVGNTLQKTIDNIVDDNTRELLEDYEIQLKRDKVPKKYQTILKDVFLEKEALAIKDKAKQLESFLSDLNLPFTTFISTKPNQPMYAIFPDWYLNPAIPLKGLCTRRDEIYTRLAKKIKNSSMKSVTENGKTTILHTQFKANAKELGELMSYAFVQFTNLPFLIYKLNPVADVELLHFSEW